MTRGRLIWRFLADIYALDSLATSLDPDDSGDLTSGYDPDFREPVLIPPERTFGSPRGEDARQETLISKLPCQVEDENEELLQAMASGDSPGYHINLIFFMEDIEQRGLLTEDGQAAVFRRSRLDALRNARTHAIVQRYSEPRAMYAQEVRPISWGLSGGERNLLFVRYEDREKSARG